MLNEIIITMFLTEPTLFTTQALITLMHTSDTTHVEISLLAFIH